MILNILFFFGFLFILYGIIVSTVGSGTGFFVAWLALGAMTIIFALSIRYDLWRKVPFFIKATLSLMVILGVLVFLCFEGLVIQAFRQEGRENLDVIIVLGAQVYQDGPSRSLQYRLDRAIEYLEENPKTRCIVSGGQGHNEPFTEAMGMSKYLREHGVDDDRILLEDQSRDTVENLEYSRKLIPEGAKIGIVTNDFHMFRALQIARGAGWKDVSGIPAASTLLFLPNNMFREFFGEMKYLFL